MTAAERKDIIGALEQALEAGVDAARTELETLRGSLEGEAKSTAGDKHETGRAMVQLEMEQAGLRLARMEAMRGQWRGLEPHRSRAVVGPGAVVETDGGLFVIGVALGRFAMSDGAHGTAISSDAPLAMALRGLEPGGGTVFRGRDWRVKRVG